ncbi:hypothetical protein RDWZM_010594 [Blomia tropicalis]|uniref:Uncharacterized protein n=1 Tax=Blomia tropicalis TaxID=40697 RepID=A0A9Q0LZD8_BLOTA|nr:hypothetical protein RDWZM_010594 [Blomia tropicalis]
MQRGSKPPTSDPLFETEDILRSLGLDDDMEETMEIDRVVWNSSIQKDVETKLLADHPPSTSAVIPSTTRPKAITSSPKPASAQAAPGLLTTAGSSRNMEIRDDTFGSFRIGSTPPSQRDQNPQLLHRTPNRHQQPHQQPQQQSDKRNHRSD